jgi:hypothetical protein
LDSKIKENTVLLSPAPLPSHLNDNGSPNIFFRNFGLKIEGKKIYSLPRVHLSHPNSTLLLVAILGEHAIT